MTDKSGLNGAVSNSTSLYQAGSCTACEKRTECKCERCGDFYCSIGCQTKDWPSHRFICFPMPKLVKVGQSLVKKEDVPRLAAKANNSSKSVNSPKCDSKKNVNHLPNGSCVYLTAFQSSNRCFVRSTNPSTVQEQQKVLNKIDDFGKTASAFTSKPKKDSIALALRDDKWCRVYILSSKDDVCKVSFTDFGERRYRSSKELRIIIPTIKNLPCHIQKVYLKNVNFSTNEKLINLLIQFTNKEYKIEYSEVDEGGGNVELFKWGSSISLNSLINELSNGNGYNTEDNNSVVSVSSNSKVLKGDLSEREGNENYKNKKADETRSPSSNNRQISKINVPVSSNSKVLKEDLSERKGNENYKNKKADETGSPSSNNGQISKINEASKQTEKPISHTTNSKEKKTDESLTAAEAQSTKVSCSPRQVQVQKPCLNPPFDIVPINEDANGAHILIMDNSYLEEGFIGCLLTKYCENLKAVAEFLNEYKFSDEPYKPKFEEYCIAKFDNIWYRAKVAEIVSEDKFLVVYIDFTNDAELSSDSIRPYPLELDFACCTSLCGIDGLPDNYSEELKKYLYEEFESFKTLKVDSVRMDGDIYYLKFNKLLQTLRDSNLI